MSEPVKKGIFQQPYNAKEEKPSCPQNFGLTNGLLVIPVSEDCLHLNVLVPGVPPLDGKSREVFVWLYGGAFQYGSSKWYTSPDFAVANDVILVTVNYRVGVTGFLANPQEGLYGNWGLWDQHLAIKWVNENIEAFGGNKNKITLFGESAGSICTIYQALFPGNKGLFNGVVAQSGALMDPIGFDHTPEIKFDSLISKVNCTSSNMGTIMSCLRNLSLVQLESAVGRFDLYFPVVDGKFIKMVPSLLLTDEAQNISGASELLEQFGKMNLIMGINSKDGALELYNKLSFLNGLDVMQNSSLDKIRRHISLTLQVNFGLGGEGGLTLESVMHEYTNWLDPNNASLFRQGYIDFVKDITFLVPITSVLATHAKLNGPGKRYFYEFVHRPSYSKSPSWLDGANHAEEIPFVFAFHEAWMLNPVGLDCPDAIIPEIPDDEKELSNTMMKYWSQFAKTGDPNVPELTNWPEYTNDEQKYIVFDTCSRHGKNKRGKKQTTLQIKDHMRLNAVDFWTRLFPLLSRCDGL